MTLLRFPDENLPYWKLPEVCLNTALDLPTTPMQDFSPPLSVANCFQLEATNDSRLACFLNLTKTSSFIFPYDRGSHQPAFRSLRKVPRVGTTRAKRGELSAPLDLLSQHLGGEPGGDGMSLR